MRTKHSSLRCAGEFAFLLFLTNLTLLPQTTGAQELPANPQRLLDTAVKNWNTVYGTHVKAVDWSYEGTIRSEEQRSQILAEMTDPLKAWFPSGDVGRPSEMTAFRVTDDPTVKAGEIAEWQSMVRGKVRVGHHIVRIRWRKDSQPFTSICITDDNELIYDSMIFNAVLVAKHSRCLDYRMWWLWEKVLGKPSEEWTRGHITADLTANCRDGVPVTCDDDCKASMSAGEAKIHCKTRIVSNCCQMEYTWAWVCGFKKIKVKADKYELEVEGWIGSSGAGNGSCTECCPVPPPKPPPARPPTPTPETPRSRVSDEGSYQTAVFDTPYGQVNVNLPKEQSDQLSGTVVANSKDQSSSDALRGMVVEVEVGGKTQQTVSVSKGIFALAGAGGALALILRDSDGKQVARQEVTMRPALPPGTDFHLPKLGQPGKTVEVRGPHNGYYEDDKLLVGRQPATFVEESKSSSVWRVPDSASLGPTTLQFQEGTEHRSGPFNVAKIQLEAPTTTLPRGGSTQITTTVSGLEGYDLKRNPLYIQEEIRTPDVVKFEGKKAGAVFTRRITPDKTKDGQYTDRTRVRAIRPGSFEITATLTEHEK